MTLDKKGSGIQWSYVIQGLEEGTFTIPAQELTFFDTLSKSYKTLTSQPLSVTITPGTPSISTVTLPPQEEPTPVISEAPLPKEFSSLPIIPQIPTLWFILLMLVPIVFTLGSFLARFISPWTTRYLQHRRSLGALKLARKQLLLLEKKGQHSQVHQVVKQALARYLDLDDPSDEDIDAALRRHSYDANTCAHVAQFLQEALDVSPYADKPSSKNSKDLFKQAREVLAQVSLRARALLIACLSIGSLQAVTITEVASHIAGSLGVIPFIVWQMGVLIGWWLLWWVAPKISPELRYSIGLIWLFFLLGWALRVPLELYPSVHVTKQVHLYVGPSETYPARAVLEPDDELALVKIDGAWYYVSSLKGKGWVPAAFIDKKVAS